MPYLGLLLYLLLFWFNGIFNVSKELWLLLFLLFWELSFPEEGEKILFKSNKSKFPSRLLLLIFLSSRKSNPLFIYIFLSNSFYLFQYF